jgi:integrase
MILKVARKRKWLKEQPLTEVGKLKEPKADIDPLDPAEVQAFLCACPSWWWPYFTVAFWSGARPNELAALKFGDLDHTRGRFHIRAGRYRGVEGPPKTESSIRHVDMLLNSGRGVPSPDGAAGRASTEAGAGGRRSPGRTMCLLVPREAC